MFDKLFGGSDSGGGEDLSVDDLVVLERYEEAETRLKALLKKDAHDLHSHQRLADVYAAQSKHTEARDAYVHVAEELTRDGFYDRALALLTRAKRSAPLDDVLDQKLERLRVIKDMERSRALALQGLRKGGATGGTAALLLQRHWYKLAPSDLMRTLAPEQLERLLTHMRLESFAEDDVLARRGLSDPLALYFVISGVLRALLRRPDGGTMGVRDFGAGDVLGEGALLEKKPWPADVVAAEAARVLVLDRDGLAQTLVGNPDPRGFLTTLRAQHSDKAVALAVHRMEGRNVGDGDGAAEAPGGDDPPA